MSSTGRHVFHRHPPVKHFVQKMQSNVERDNLIDKLERDGVLYYERYFQASIFIQFFCKYLRLAPGQGKCNKRPRTSVVCWQFESKTTRSL